MRWTERLVATPANLLRYRYFSGGAMASFAALAK
jgi:hypothetical protein